MESGQGQVILQGEGCHKGPKGTGSPALVPC